MNSIHETYLSFEEREQYARDHKNLIFPIIKKYRGVFEDHDLISAANLGLALAILRFDPNRGFKFSTLAYQTVRFYVMGFVYRENIRRAKYRGIVSTDTPLGDSPDGSFTVMDLIGGEEEFGYRKAEIQIDLKEIIAHHSERNQNIFSLYFEYGYKYAKIAEMYGMSSQNVSLIVRGIRKELKEKRLI